MKRLIKPKPIWIALTLSLFIHFLIINHFDYLSRVSSDKIKPEKSHMTSMSLKLKTDYSSPIKSSKIPSQKSVPDSQNIKNPDTEKQLLQMEEKSINRKSQTKENVQDNADEKEIARLPGIKMIDKQEKVTEDSNKKSSPDKVVKEETSQGQVKIEEKNHKIEQESEKKLPLNRTVPVEKVKEEPLKEDRKISMRADEPVEIRKVKPEMKNEVKQEKERHLTSQSEKDEFLKEKTVPGDYYIASREADCKNEAQVKKNPEIEKALDFTGNSYPNNVNPPELLEFQRPVYPKNLRERDVEGKVILKLLIDREGKVEDIQVFESSGYKAFDNIAVEAVRQWWFKPARKKNRQKKCRVLIPINFQIK